MEPVQILMILFALFAFSRAVLRVKERAISIKEFILWSFVWISVAVVGFIPGVTTFFASKAGIRRGVDFAVYASVILLFYLNFRMYVKTEKLNSDITRLVREIAKK